MERFKPTAESILLNYHTASVQQFKTAEEDLESALNSLVELHERDVLQQVTKGKIEEIEKLMELPLERELIRERLSELQALEGDKE